VQYTARKKWVLYIYTTTVMTVDFHSAISLKQQSAYRHVTPLIHIILIPSQLIFVLFP